MENESDVVKTTHEVNECYKSCAPKFEEKIDTGDTEDLVALCHKRKPFVVRFSIAQRHLHFIVLCLYYACTMIDTKLFTVLCHLCI